MQYITVSGAFQYDKLETQYRKSTFCGLNFSPLLLFLLLLDFTLINVITLMITILTTIALLKKHPTQVRFVRIIILIPSLMTKSKEFSLLSTLIANQIYVPQWPLQIVLQLLTIRSMNQFYAVLLLGMLSRYLEIQKRKLFAAFSDSDLKLRQHSRVLAQVPQQIYIVDENAKILSSNQEGILEENVKLLEAVRRKKPTNFMFKNREYLVQPWDGNYRVVQVQFSNSKNDLFEQLCSLIDFLYNQLCQDYQKWNNLRAFKVVKESDLCILGSCASDCRILKQQLETMNFLMHDEQQTPWTNQRVEFFLKNYVINVVESMMGKLHEHFSLVELEFEQGIPDILVGDKFSILYCLYTFLLSTTLVDYREEKLFIDARVAQVNNDKSGYDLEFTLLFPCTPKQIRLYSHQEYGTLDEHVICYMINKCKDSTKIEYKSDGDNIVILLTTNVSWSGKENNSDNIQLADINFTRNIITQDHYSWKARRSASPPITYDKSMRSPLHRVTAKFNNPDSLASTIQLIPQSTHATAPNSVAQSLDTILYENDVTQEVEKAIIYTLQFPEIKDAIISLLEDTLQQAYSQGLLDHEKTILELGSVPDDKICSISVTDSQVQQECSESVRERNETIRTLPRQFITPQLKPRQLKQFESDRRHQLQLLNYKKKKEKFTLAKKSKNQKQLSLLFSPCVMSKFKNNLIQHSQKSKTHLPLIIDNQRDQVNFNTRIRDHRFRKQKRIWSHKIKLDQLPTLWPQILCLIPNTQLTSVAKRFGNSMYGEKMIGDPIIAYDVPELIQVYKEYFAMRRQFCFLLIYIQKLSQIDELSQAILSNESQFAQDCNFKPTVLIGVYNQTQLNKNLYQYLKYTIPISQDTQQLQKSKDWIAQICK